MNKSKHAKVACICNEILIQWWIHHYHHHHHPDNSWSYPPTVSFTLVYLLSQSDSGDSSGGGDKVNLFSLMPCTCWGCEGAAINLLLTTGISPHPHWPPNSLFSHVLFLENLIKQRGNKFSDQWLDDKSIDLTVCDRLQFQRFLLIFWMF